MVNLIYDGLTLILNTIPTFFATPRNYLLQTENASITAERLSEQRLKLKAQKRRHFYR